MDAALHYLLHGGREGRDPGPFFSTRQYLVRYPDVAASGLNALAHYETHGRREKRNIPLLKGRPFRAKSPHWAPETNEKRRIGERTHRYCTLSCSCRPRPALTSVQLPAEPSGDGGAILRVCPAIVVARGMDDEAGPPM